MGGSKGELAVPVAVQEMKATPAESKAAWKNIKRKMIPTRAARSHASKAVDDARPTRQYSYLPNKQEDGGFAMIPASGAPTDSFGARESEPSTTPCGIAARTTRNCRPR